MEQDGVANLFHQFSEKQMKGSTDKSHNQR